MDWPNSNDREAELRRRNEEISRQAGEAMRVAQAVVRQQEAKLVQSPGSQARSPQRQSPQERIGGSSVGDSPDHRSSSARESRSSGKFFGVDEEGRGGEEVEYERPSSTRKSPQKGPQRHTTSAGSARRELHMEEGRAAEREVVTPQMGAEATIRYLKAKLKVMEEELEESVAEAKESREKLYAVEKRLHEAEQSSAKAGAMQTNARMRTDKLKAELDEKTKLVDSLERQLAASVREKENIERTQRQQDSATGARDVRLNRALEEVDKYKRMLAEEKTMHAEHLESQNKQLDKVMAEKKKLVRQKKELLNGFKKQMRLIDILRRQLIHVQAAKLLSLTEEEFTRALELGETI